MFPLSGLYEDGTTWRHKQRFLTPGHQGWNDLHSLCRIGMEYYLLNNDDNNIIYWIMMIIMIMMMIIIMIIMMTMMIIGTATIMIMIIIITTTLTMTTRTTRTPAFWGYPPPPPPPWFPLLLTSSFWIPSPYYWSVHIGSQVKRRWKPKKLEKFAKKYKFYNFVITLTHNTSSNGSDYLWQIWK